MCAAGLALWAIAGMVDAAQADTWRNPRTTYGEIGLLDMPSARMAPDGELSLTVGALQGTQRYNLGFQILPWLEGSFRYSHIIKFTGTVPFYDRSFGLKIRLFEEMDDFPEVSLGLRDMLGTGVYAGEYLVASKRLGDVDLTLGVGWGRFAQEAAFRNPFAVIFPSFKTRDTSFGQGGTVAFGQFFHGPKAGVFGGVVWRTPIDNLDLLAEYSSDAYQDEVATGSIKVRVPVNVGLSYRPYDALSISAGWFYGTSYGVTVSMSTDPTVPSLPIRLGPSVPPPVERTDKQQANALTLLMQPRNALSNRPSPFVQLPAAPLDAAAPLIAALMSGGAGVRDAELMGNTVMIDTSNPQALGRQCDLYAHIAASTDARVETIALVNFDDPNGNTTFCKVTQIRKIADTVAAAPPVDGEIPQDMEARIVADVAAQALRVEAVALQGADVWLYFQNTHYSTEDEAVGRISRVLMKDAPPTVEVFHLVSVKRGIVLRQFDIARSALERAALGYSAAIELGDAIDIVAPPLSNPILEHRNDGTYPRFSWAVGPSFRQGLFDPDQPVQIQVYASADAALEILPGLSIETRLEASVFNNFNTGRPSNSVLPHVRSDSALYYNNGRNGISLLDVSYRTKLTRDVYAEIKAGYLEDMFAGAGAQVLWRPENDRFAFGLDVYEVWQRNFDRLVGVQSYHVLTGHASAYYASPWYDLNFAVHAGRYLAGDYGATFEITRRFSTGVEIGAFATFTNVPFAKFGEGSFDKGIYIHIPLEWGLPFYTQSAYDLTLRSLTRDGGARLEKDNSLYQDTLATSYGEITRHLDDITTP